MECLQRRGVFKGQVNIHIEYICGKLRIHVIEARQLSSKWTTTCDAYVQVSLIPDETLRSRWSSKTVCKTNAPSFQQSVDIELLPGDEDKRLMVSAYHMDTNKSCSEFLGCMSFGVRHLKSKTKRKGVEGWYYLLSEELGFRKHLTAPPTITASNEKFVDEIRVSDPRPPLEGATSSPSKPSTPDIDMVNRRTQGMESLTLVIYKTESGYGFTVKNACPVRVGRVKSHGPSERAGLLKGDFIIRINGQNVSTASAQTIAEVVRRSSKFLVVDIRRPNPKSSFSSDLRYSQNSQMYSMVSDSEMSAKVDSQSGSSCHSDSQSLSSYQSDNYSFGSHGKESGVSSHHSDEENMPPGSRAVYKSSQRGKHPRQDSPSRLSKKSSQSRKRHHAARDLTIETFPMSLDSTHLAPNNTMCSDYSRVHSKVEADGKSDCDLTTWDPEISVISTTESLRNRHVYSHCDLTISNICDKNLTQSLCPSAWSQWIETSLRKTESPWQLNTRDSFQNKTENVSDEVLDKCMQPGSVNSNDSAFGSSGSSHKESMSDDSYHGDDVIRAAILDLVECEREFAGLMQQGIQQYSRPLRHGLLSAEQHIALFQNVEKLVALSEYNIRQLSELSCGLDQHSSLGEDVDVEEIADVYSTRVRLLCSAYKTYLDGLPSALKTLQDLHQYRSFNKFLQKQCIPDLSIEAFLQHPQRHLVNMSGCFRSLLKLLPNHRQEHESLTLVVDAIRTNCLREVSLH